MQIRKALKSKLSKDIGLTFISQVIIMLIAFSVNKVLSLKLGVEGYGQYSVIKKSTAVISFVMLSGMGIALPKYLSRYLEVKNYSRFIAVILMSMKVLLLTITITILLLLIWRTELMSLVIGSDSMVLYYVAFIYALSQTLITYILSYYRGIDNFRMYSLYQVLVQLGVVVIALLFGSNIYDLFLYWGCFTIAFFLCLVSQEVITNKKMFSYSNTVVNKTEFKELLLFGLPRLGGDFLLFGSSAIPLIIIANNLNDNAVAFFSVGIMFISIVSPVFSLVGTALLPYVSRLLAKKNNELVMKTINTMGVLYLVISFFSIMFFYVFMDSLIQLFFSIEFIQAAETAKILILGILPYSLYLLLRNPIDALSIKPYNTITLLISFFTLMILFYYSTTLIQYAISYVIADCVKGLLSLVIWNINKKKC